LNGVSPRKVFSEGERQMSDERKWGPCVIEGGDANFVREVRDNLNAINRYALGFELFAIIKGTGKTCYIEYTQNTFNSDSFFRPWGSNAPRILCDPDYLWRKEFEPTIATVRARRRLFIYYWHELVHCLHVATGGYRAPKWDAEEEFRTVGLFQYEHGGDFTENALRRVLRLPRRPVYCWSEDADPVKLFAEKQRRLSLNLPENPRDYIRDVEDSFDQWARRAWLRPPSRT
jgi:hypothetical protein